MLADSFFPRQYGNQTNNILFDEGNLRPVRTPISQRRRELRARTSQRLARTQIPYDLFSSHVLGNQPLAVQTEAHPPEFCHVSLESESVHFGSCLHVPHFRSTV